MSQLGGGIGTRGPGETQLETDRRKINLRIDHIKTQLDAVRRIRYQGKPNIRVASRKVVYPTCWGQHTKVKSSALGFRGEGRGHSSSP